VKRFIGENAKAEVSMRKGYSSKKAIAEVAVFILGLALGTRVNTNDLLALRLDTRL
jgi:hypothetical protein